jgi:hypothetical protein
LTLGDEQVDLGLVAVPQATAADPKSFVHDLLNGNRKFDICRGSQGPKIRTISYKLPHTTKRSN